MVYLCDFLFSIAIKSLCFSVSHFAGHHTFISNDGGVNYFTRSNRRHRERSRLDSVEFSNVLLPRRQCFDLTSFEFCVFCGQTFVGKTMIERVWLLVFIISILFVLLVIVTMFRLNNDLPNLKKMMMMMMTMKENE